jgi:hypothetical protein
MNRFRITLARLATAGALLLGLSALAGCGGAGGDGLAPVSGTVTIDGKPGDGAAVAFLPDAGTPGNGGTALADSTGHYDIQTPQGKKGLPPGKYKVTVSYRRNKDGSAPDPNVPPIESTATELLPPKYSSAEKTELAATVGPEAKPFDYKLQSAKKK